MHSVVQLCIALVHNIVHQCAACLFRNTTTTFYAQQLRKKFISWKSMALSCLEMMDDRWELPWQFNEWGNEREMKFCIFERWCALIILGWPTIYLSFCWFENHVLVILLKAALILFKLITKYSLKWNLFEPFCNAFPLHAIYEWNEKFNDWNPNDLTDDSELGWKPL